MGSYIKLKAADGHEFDAYVAESSAPPRAAVVVIQEIFGVNSHIRSVADGYAAQGFLAIAPALFDRVEPHLELGYDSADAGRGMKVAMQIGIDAALKDVAAAINYAGDLLKGGKVGVVGYCFGGTLAWLAATRLNPAAVVGYYGGQIAKFAAENPKCPVLLHFGAKDAHIPASEIETIRQHHPDLPVFIYDAGHGFNCDQRQSFHAPSAALARERSLEFFRKQLLEG
jgi:carboxymethylenebutenolidase